MSSLSLVKDERLRIFLEYFGLIVLGYSVLKTSLRLFNNIGTFFLGFGTLNLKKYGSWAVVTGCTDGIGKAYAEHLAKRGLNVVLISRTLEKLQEQAKFLTDKYKVETKVIAVDFTEQTSIYTTIRNELGDLDIGVLVNNVGMSYKSPEFFDVYGQSDKDLSNLINCNITSLTKMTAIVLPNMVKKRKGIIINNASGSGRIPTPLLTVYSATKAYVDFFSR
jgi:17beta-estradiol 17-dehydrogenase / very-long-chain 3-oxoacyl-CoA reductase